MKKRKEKKNHRHQIKSWLVTRATTNDGETLNIRKLSYKAQFYLNFKYHFN
jgi:hypothetical protein